MVNRWIKNVHSWLLPSRCILCAGPGLHGLDLCSACLADLPRLGACCSVCALPLAGIQSERETCGRCLRDPPAYDRVISSFLYASPVDVLIQELKFNARLQNATVLGQLMLNSVLGSGTALPQLIIPMPLHGGRMRERGFNQALELARPIAHALNLPLAPRACERIRATPSQSGLDAVHRRRNIRGAFIVRDLPDVQNVVIVDDVMTTGSTMNELALMLKRAGVKQVQAWVCARAS